MTAIFEDTVEEIKNKVDNNWQDIAALGMASAVTYLLFYTDSVEQLAGSGIDIGLTRR